ncbi:MAG: GNAT family N-acetyltransferase [Acidobacteriota bacterium]|nr:GNAT family N-acetyltransferase [Acidobacteriota bacterium]
MKLQPAANSSKNSTDKPFAFQTARNLSGAQLLTETDKHEVLSFLKMRPVHTVVMTSFINDNGMKSANNRGRFYGFRNLTGGLEGVALIGHTTLVEARSEQAVAEFARVAGESETPIHFMMSDGSTIENFWKYFVDDSRQPRRICTENLFEISQSARPHQTTNLRIANESELLPIAEAHAEVAFQESGVNPMERDREGFLRRTLARIEKGRTWVVFENGELLFKADIVAENSEVMYLEGIYVNPKLRGKGLGANCLSHLCSILLDKVKHICLLSNVEFKNAHRAYLKAGFTMQNTFQTIFV